VPDAGVMSFLPRLIGLSKAKEPALTRPGATAAEAELQTQGGIYSHFKANKKIAAAALISGKIAGYNPESILIWRSKLCQI